MFEPDQYRLIDFGAGRRLEAFGPWRLDRPCPAAEGLAREDEPAWAKADARYEPGAEGQDGRWRRRPDMPERWTVAHGPLRLELKLGPVGHVGVFPEQAVNWDWLAGQIAAAPRPVELLNLFAHTGGSTLAAAAAGAKVVHVDAARNTVAWARRNAELSDLAAAPIRWIAEDAAKFVRRELKRGHGYDAVILDPPSYGHGPRGEVWQLAKHLPDLLAACGPLTAGRRRFILLTCHTPEFDADRLGRMMREALGGPSSGAIEAGELAIQSTTDRHLPSGVFVRWTAT
ncbi:MAG: class I SAM-dependent methyltransferase [Pirellulales bacterium]|nr:class I SAM-dependent methyltransferase [Pirellulales bacterium]